MTLDAEVALDLGQVGSDAVRCFPTGMRGGHGESSPALQGGDPRAQAPLPARWLADKSCSSPASVSPRDRVGAHCGVVEAIVCTTGLRLEKAKKG